MFETKKRSELVCSLARSLAHSMLVFAMALLEKQVLKELKIMFSQDDVDEELQDKAMALLKTGEARLEEGRQTLLEQAHAFLRALDATIVQKNARLQDHKEYAFEQRNRPRLKRQFEEET